MRPAETLSILTTPIENLFLFKQMEDLTEQNCSAKFTQKIYLQILTILYHLTIALSIIIKFKIAYNLTDY